jgi:NAD(P)-dependent dehydrogenase (short-subunit alcohol dehydrogenase family)
MPDQRSFVVTGAAQGVGRAIAERLATGGHVVVDVADSLGWQHERVHLITGDPRDAELATRAAQLAEAAAPADRVGRRS